MQTFRDVLTLTAIATTTWDAYDLVSFSDAKITTDDAVVKGVAMHPATAIGQAIAVMAIGTIRLRARGAITKGGKVISAAAGGVKAIGAGSNPFGVALTDAADGALVEILIR